MKPLQLNQETIPFKRTARYLGVTLDDKLTWNAHVEQKCMKGITLIGQSRRVVGRTWGLNPKTMLWIYKTIVRPTLAYGALIWAPALERKTTAERMERVQRAACLAITGAMKSTPTKAMEVALDLLPLDVFLQGEAMKAGYRVKVGGFWRTRMAVSGRGLKKKGHVRWHQEQGRKISIMEMPCDKRPYVLHFGRGFQVRIQEKLEGQGRADMIYFTDGSRREDRAGAGAIGFERRTNAVVMKESVALGKLATVFQAEIVAIHMTAKELIRRKTEGMDVRINSDSQAALKALCAVKVKSQLVDETIRSLNRLAEKNQVTLHWVKGHSGVIGNEAADELAREGSGRNLTGPEPGVPVSTRTCSSEVERWTQEEHSRRWEREKGCKQSKASMPRLSRKRARDLIASGRKMIRKLCGILTGHCGLNGHLGRIGVKETTICPACELRKETPLHYMGQCPAFAQQRERVFGVYTVSREELNQIPLWKQAVYLKATKRLEAPKELVGES